VPPAAQGSPSARYVRIELPGKGKLLQLAEVQVFSGGENIDPSEVEHALLSCGGLNAALVFGVSDSEFGARVAVAIEPTNLADFDERTLFAALNQRLASFKQPRALCVFEALPRLTSGKLDRARIRSEASGRLRPPDRGQD